MDELKYRDFSGCNFWTPQNIIAESRLSKRSKRWRLLFLRKCSCHPDFMTVYAILGKAGGWRLHFVFIAVYEQTWNLVLVTVLVSMKRLNIEPSPHSQYEIVTESQLAPHLKMRLSM